MDKRTRVAIYGSSLSMAGIAASLKTEAGLEVVCVEADWPLESDPWCEVIAHALPASGQDSPGARPDVILFDIHAIQPALHRVLEPGSRGLRLIGLDSNSNATLVLSACPAQALSVEELIQIILRGYSNSEEQEGGTMKRTIPDDLQQKSPEKEGA